MKKYFLTLFLASITFIVYANGILNGDFNVKNILSNVCDDCYDISIINKEVYSNNGGYNKAMHTIVEIGDFQKVNDYNKIGILGIIIKDGTNLPDKPDMFKLSSEISSNGPNDDSYSIFSIKTTTCNQFKLSSEISSNGQNDNSYYTIVRVEKKVSSQIRTIVDYKLLKVKSGIAEQALSFKKENGFFKCNFTSPLYLNEHFSDSSISGNIHLIVDYNETVNESIAKSNEKLIENSRQYLKSDLKDNRNGTQILGEEKFKLERYPYKGIVNYRALRYSDGFTKIIDDDNNWILYKTQYETDEYTGEETKKPVSLSNYYNNSFPVAANFERDRLRLILSDQTVTFIHPCKMQFSIKANNEILKYVRQSFFWDPLFGDYNIKDYFTEFPRLRDNDYIVQSNCDDCFDRVETPVNKYIVRGPNGNILEDLTEFYFSGFYRLSNLPNSPFYYYNNRTTKYFDRTTGKIYICDDLYYNGKEPGQDVDVLQICSLSKGDPKISSIYDDDLFLINCFPSDTITRWENATNVGGIYFSNGDYIKYSKLQGAYNPIYEGLVHRHDGVLTVRKD
ncbi:MAG: hypothetical protein IKR18_06215, partial [Bacteroidaceae bacterium]|nr:hypothetical protein [Bacteroidaceae bacterium]